MVEDDGSGSDGEILESQDSDGSNSDADSFVHELTEEEVEEEDTDYKLDVDVGSIVWVTWGKRRYLARVVLTDPVPAEQRESLSGPGQNNARFVFVKFYGESAYGLADKWTLQPLGSMAQDLRWSRISGMANRSLRPEVQWLDENCVVSSCPVFAFRCSVLF